MKKLVIEVDGGYHQLPEVKLSDEQRTAVLEANGCRVLRFANEEIISQPTEVLQTIEQVLTQEYPSLAEGARDDSMVEPENWVPIIARAGMNIPHLKDKLYEAVINEQVAVDQTIVSNARHYEALDKAYQALDAVLEGMASGITSDFIAMDIRRSLHHLGEITGEISTDDLLGNIFGKFCIGK